MSREIFTIPKYVTIVNWAIVAVNYLYYISPLSQKSTVPDIIAIIDIFAIMFSGIISFGIIVYLIYVTVKRKVLLQSWKLMALTFFNIMYLIIYGYIWNVVISVGRFI